MKEKRRSKSKKRATKSSEDVVADTQYQNWTVKALKQKLVELDLPTKGKKVELIKRLATHGINDNTPAAETTENNGNSWWAYVSKWDFVVGARRNINTLFQDIYTFIKYIFLFICWNLIAYQMGDNAICSIQQRDNACLYDDAKSSPNNTEHFCCTSAIGSFRQIVRTLFIVFTAVPLANKIRGYQGAFICLYASLSLYDLNPSSVLGDIFIWFILYLLVWHCIMPVLLRQIGLFFDWAFFLAVAYSFLLFIGFIIFNISDLGEIKK